MLKRITLIGSSVLILGALLLASTEIALAKTETYGRGGGRGRQGAGSGQSTGASVFGWTGQENKGYAWGTVRGTNFSGFMLSDTGELDVADRDALIYMREEEKLAHDVYLAMYELWGAPIFQNISSSEQRHTEAVKNLLDGFDIPDPALDAAGTFTNPELQALYNELVTLGGQSLADALKVGAAIEEIDILDLQEHLGETDNAAIQRVFSNLLRGSSNHLRAFTSTLAVQGGETYVPQYMSEQAYQSIDDSSTQGRNQGGGRGRGRAGSP